MSFLLGLLKTIHSSFKLFKKTLLGYKVKRKDIIKVIGSGVITFTIVFILVIAIIGGALYSVTGAVGDLFNSLQKMHGSSELPPSSFYENLTDGQIEKLIDETGASFNPSKVALYIKKQEESVPSSIQSKRITINGSTALFSSDTKSVEDVNIDISKYANKYKVNWEFIAAIDLAGFTADDKSNTTAIDKASTLFPKFTWMNDTYRTTTDTSRSWTETYEYDPTTGETTQTENTYDKSSEIYTTVKEPLAIPSKVTTLFGDYNYTVNKDVTLIDSNYCTPYINSREVTTEQRYNGKKPDYNQPIYVEEKTNMVQGQDTGNSYSLRDWKNSNLDSDTDIIYEYVGEEDDFYKYSYSYFFGLLHKYIYIYKDDIPESEVEQDIKYIGISTKQVFSGDYVMVDDYKTITITKNTMKKTKQKVQEDQVGTITQNFNPTIFIQYLNSCNLSIDDLELVRETLINIPNGNYLLDNIQRIIDGDYGDINNIPVPNGGDINLDGLIPLFLQADERWANHPYSGSTIGRAGCGITSMSMVVTGLGGDINNVKQYDVDSNGFLDPYEVSLYATANGHSTNREGTMRSLYGDLGAKMGLKVTNAKNPNEVYAALQEGKVAISSMTPGHFTKASHLIVLTGVSSDGTVTVNDPASEERSHQTWDFNIVKSEADDFWIIENQNVVTETFTITSYFGATYADGLPASEVQMEGDGQLHTSTGMDLSNKDLRDRICAVDPSVIPYHSKLFINFHDISSVTLPDGTPCALNGYYTAEDTGGAFQGGRKKIDLYAGTYGKSPKYRDIAFEIGSRDATVRYRKKS